MGSPTENKTRAPPPPSPGQREALTLVEAGRFLPGLVRESDGWHARWLPAVPVSGAAVAGWIDAFVRRAALTPLTADAEDVRHETLHDAWLDALRSRTGLVRADDAACAAFASVLAGWQGAADEDVDARAALGFSFVAEGAEGSFSVSCPVPKGRRALRALGQAGAVFTPLRRLRRDGGDVLRVAFTKAEAEAFLRTGAPALASAGYRVAGVERSADVTAEADLVARDGAPAAEPFAARLVVRVDGERVTAEEIRFLLDQKSTFVFFRNRWIEVDVGVLREALRALEKRDGRALGVNGAVAFASGLGSAGRLALERVRAHGWLRGLLNELRGDERFSPSRFVVPDRFRGVLRPYQHRAAAWLAFLARHGFGALLADDMGLGKTVETIAWIASLDRPAGEPVLVVAPLTLLANWRHELAAFAPDLRVLVHHGDKRLSGTAFAAAARRAAVVVTAYSLLVRDHRLLREVAWHAVVLDEAQLVKNPDAQVSRAARSLHAPRRVALTGTPVENSAADLWCLQEFLNPGFLGDRKTFDERFARPLAADAFSSAGRRLRRALEPFLLRRLKTDPEIASELGEKREIREYCALAPRQRRAYEDALEIYRAGERRPGDVFALLTRLKLVCDSLDGGKFERLCELVASVSAAGESLLVFTQYAKVGAALAKALGARLGAAVPFLHGGLDAAARQRAIDAFNAGGPERAGVFVLSLRAGGYGLNLVKATHVVHYDRWWNPAVENQATDRTHRIGQKKTVFVHVFVTEGTMEERIDAILRSKSVLASSLVSGGESFLAKMSAEEFERTVALDAEEAER